MRFRLLALPAAAILAAQSGCTGATATSPVATPTPPPPYTLVEPAQITPSDQVDPPREAPALTLTGRIGRPNAGSHFALDMATLERLRIVEYPMDDPAAQGRRATFRGVLLRDVLEVAGVPGDASTLHAVALNGYTVELPVEEVRAMPVMLATRVDGERIGVNHFGPIRVIYPMEQLKLDRNIYDTRLIWQLASIDVR